MQKEIKIRVGKTMHEEYKNLKRNMGLTMGGLARHLIAKELERQPENMKSSRYE